MVVNMSRDEGKYFTKREDVVSYLTQILPVIKDERVSGVYLYNEESGKFLEGFLSFEHDNLADSIDQCIAIVFENYFLYVCTLECSKVSLGFCVLTDEDRKRVKELSDLLNNETFVYGLENKKKCVVSTDNIDRMIGFDVEVLDHPVQAWVKKNDRYSLKESVVYEDGFNRITLLFEGGNELWFTAEAVEFECYMAMGVKDISYHEIDC